MAGTRNTDGYYRVQIDGTFFSCHRIVLSLSMGRLIEPGVQVDHRDGNRSNNAIDNLRSCNASENGQNRKPFATKPLSGYPGVEKARRRWRARIMVNSKTIFLGTFPTPEAAYHAYLAAKKVYHPFAPTDATDQFVDAHAH